MLEPLKLLLIQLNQGEKVGDIQKPFDTCLSDSLILPKKQQDLFRSELDLPQLENFIREVLSSAELMPLAYTSDKYGFGDSNKEL